MMSYESVKLELMTRESWTQKEYESRIRLAQLWHNPLNFDDGEEIKIRYGWSSLFTEERVRHGLGKRRFYFNFRDYDMTDTETVFQAFFHCENFPAYSRLWNRTAPREIRSKALYLLAITEMSVKGFKHEEKVLKEISDSGRSVIRSTAEEDYRGVDAWVDGKPIQIKSPATARRMK